MRQSWPEWQRRVSRGWWCGLRAIAVLAAFVAFAFSFSPAGGSLLDLLRASPVAAPAPARIDAWLAPPAHTRKPATVLSGSGQDGPIATPAGSVMTVRVSGGDGTETLSYQAGAGPARAIVAQAPGSFTDTATVDGAYVLSAKGGELARWPLSLTPDQAPRIAWIADPKRAAKGGLQLEYTILDDYGATQALAELRVASAAKGARPLYPEPDLPLALPRRSSADGKARTIKDFVTHPFAGAEITITLVARDAGANEGRSEPRTVRLPERRFTDPLARALIEQRRLLALDANARRRIADLMDAITIRPADTIPVAAHFLGVVTARARLKDAVSDDDLRGVVDYLWQVAVGIEDSGLSQAEKRLRQAEENLQSALEQGADEQEIARLMDELRKAMDEFLRELAENADPRQQPDQSAGETRELRKSDIDRMMQEIERLARSGERQKAQDMLSQLREMMENLQTARRNGQNGQQADNPMRRGMNKLGEIMRRQQELMNETNRTGRQGEGRDGEGNERAEGGDNGPRGDNGQGGEEQGNQRGEGRGEQGFGDLQGRQGDLRGELGELSEMLEGLGLEPGPGFGEAGDAMGKAGDALGQGERDDAVGQQGRALEALRQGAQDMMRQMQEAMGDQPGGGMPGARQGAGRDPLGRPERTDGPDFGETVDVPDEIDAERARRILEAIRKRLGDALSPDEEKRYLERLIEDR